MKLAGEIAPSRRKIRLIEEVAHRREEEKQGAQVASPGSRRPPRKGRAVLGRGSQERQQEQPGQGGGGKDVSVIRECGAVGSHFPEESSASDGSLLVIRPTDTKQ